jgi:hypothetical protein
MRDGMREGMEAIVDVGEGLKGVDSCCAFVPRCVCKQHDGMKDGDVPWRIHLWKSLVSWD